MCLVWKLCKKEKKRKVKKKKEKEKRKHSINPDGLEYNTSDISDFRADGNTSLREAPERTTTAQSVRS